MHVVGNSVVDALMQNGAVAEKRSRVLETLGLKPRGYVLLTFHRAENVDGKAKLAQALDAFEGVIEESGLGGSCVLTDCVPSKTLIATSSLMAQLEDAGGLGVRFAGPGAPRSHARADAPRIYARIRDLAAAQSADVQARLTAEGVEVIAGRGRLARPGVVVVGEREIGADTVLIATGAQPRVLPAAVPARERRAPLADQGVVALVELPDKLVRVREPGRLFDLGARGVGLAVGDVLPDGGMKQQRVLQNKADLAAQ